MSSDSHPLSARAARRQVAPPLALRAQWSPTTRFTLVYVLALVVLWRCGSSIAPYENDTTFMVPIVISFGDFVCVRSCADGRQITRN